MLSRQAAYVCSNFEDISCLLPNREIIGHSGNSLCSKFSDPGRVLEEKPCPAPLLHLSLIYHHCGNQEACISGQNCYGYSCVFIILKWIKSRIR